MLSAFTMNDLSTCGPAEEGPPIRFEAGAFKLASVGKSQGTGLRFFQHEKGNRPEPDMAQPRVRRNAVFEWKNNQGKRHGN